MSKARIRAFDWDKDIKEAIRIIYDVWFFDIENPLVGHMCSNYFLMHYLRQSTFLMAAVDDNDKLIGFLGLTDKCSKREFPLVGHMCSNYFLMHYLRQSTFLMAAVDDNDKLIGFLGLTDKCSKREFAKCKWLDFKAAVFEKISLVGMYVLPGSKTPRLFDGLFFSNYDKLRKMVPNKDAPEFLVLIADPNARGMGVGKTLMIEGEQYLKQAGFKSYYLITDSSCDYGFYDKFGMDRVVDVSMSFNINHVEDYDHYLNCFLRGMVYVKGL